MPEAARGRRQRCRRRRRLNLACDFAVRADIEPLRGLDDIEVPRVDHDDCGDGSLVILFTPGHTPGELSLLVRLPGRNVVLHGDTVHLREAMTTLAPMACEADVVESIRSIPGSIC